MHRYFESRIAQLENSAGAPGSTTTAKTVLAMLRDWFLNHILEEDRKIALHI